MFAKKIVGYMGVVYELKSVKDGKALYEAENKYSGQGFFVDQVLYDQLIKEGRYKEIEDEDN